MLPVLRPACSRTNDKTWPPSHARGIHLLYPGGMIWTNVASYPRWQAYLRERQPPSLVVWGKHDLSFTVAGAVAFGEDVTTAEVHLLDAGHFALDEAAPEIADLIRSFFDRRGC